MQSQAYCTVRSTERVNNPLFDGGSILCEARLRDAAHLPLVAALMHRGQQPDASMDSTPCPSTGSGPRLPTLVRNPSHAPILTSHVAQSHVAVLLAGLSAYVSLLAAAFGAPKPGFRQARRLHLTPATPVLARQAMTTVYATCRFHHPLPTLLSPIYTRAVLHLLPRVVYAQGWRGPLSSRHVQSHRVSLPSLTDSRGRSTDPSEERVAALDEGCGEGSSSTAGDEGTPADYTHGISVQVDQSGASQGAQRPQRELVGDGACTSVADRELVCVGSQGPRLRVGAMEAVVVSADAGVTQLPNTRGVALEVAVGAHHMCAEQQEGCDARQEPILDGWDLGDDDLVTDTARFYVAASSDGVVPPDGTIQAAGIPSYHTAATACESRKDNSHAATTSYGAASSGLWMSSMSVTQSETPGAALDELAVVAPTADPYQAHGLDSKSSQYCYDALIPPGEVRSTVASGEEPEASVLYPRREERGQNDGVAEFMGVADVVVEEKGQTQVVYGPGRFDAQSDAQSDAALSLLDCDAKHMHGSLVQRDAPGHVGSGPTQEDCHPTHAVSKVTPVYIDPTEAHGNSTNVASDTTHVHRDLAHVESVSSHADGDVVKGVGGIVELRSDIAELDTNLPHKGKGSMVGITVTGNETGSEAEESTSLAHQLDSGASEEAIHLAAAGPGENRVSTTGLVSPWHLPAAADVLTSPHEASVQLAETYVAGVSGSVIQETSVRVGSAAVAGATQISLTWASGGPVEVSTKRGVECDELASAGGDHVPNYGFSNASHRAAISADPVGLPTDNEPSIIGSAATPPQQLEQVKSAAGHATQYTGTVVSGREDTQLCAHHVSSVTACNSHVERPEIAMADPQGVSGCGEQVPAVASATRVEAGAFVAAVVVGGSVPEVCKSGTDAPGAAASDLVSGSLELEVSDTATEELLAPVADTHAATVPEDAQATAVLGEAQAEMAQEDAQAAVVVEDTQGAVVAEEAQADVAPEDAQAAMVVEDAQYVAVPEDAKDAVVVVVVVENGQADADTHVDPVADTNAAHGSHSCAAPVEDTHVARVALPNSPQAPMLGDSRLDGYEYRACDVDAKILQTHAPVDDVPDTRAEDGLVPDTGTSDELVPVGDVLDAHVVDDVLDTHVVDDVIDTHVVDDVLDTHVVELLVRGTQAMEDRESGTLTAEAEPTGVHTPEDPPPNTEVAGGAAPDIRLLGVDIEGSNSDENMRDRASADRKTPQEHYKSCLHSDFTDSHVPGVDHLDVPGSKASKPAELAASNEPTSHPPLALPTRGAELQPAGHAGAPEEPNFGDYVPAAQCQRDQGTEPSTEAELATVPLNEEARRSEESARVHVGPLVDRAHQESSDASAQAVYPVGQLTQSTSECSDDVSPKIVAPRAPMPVGGGSSSQGGGRTGSSGAVDEPSLVVDQPPPSVALPGEPGTPSDPRDAESPADDVANPTSSATGLNAYASHVLTADPLAGYNERGATEATVWSSDGSSGYEQVAFVLNVAPPAHYVRGGVSNGDGSNADDSDLDVSNSLASNTGGSNTDISNSDASAQAAKQVAYKDTSEEDTSATASDNLWQKLKPSSSQGGPVVQQATEAGEEPLSQPGSLAGSHVFGQDQTELGASSQRQSHSAQQHIEQESNVTASATRLPLVPAAFASLSRSKWGEDGGSDASKHSSQSAGLAASLWQEAAVGELELVEGCGVGQEGGSAGELSGSEDGSYSDSESLAGLPALGRAAALLRRKSVRRGTLRACHTPSLLRNNLDDLQQELDALIADEALNPSISQDDPAPAPDLDATLPSTWSTHGGGATNTSGTPAALVSGHNKARQRVQASFLEPHAGLGNSSGALLRQIALQVGEWVDEAGGEGSGVAGIAATRYKLGSDQEMARPAGAAAGSASPLGTRPSAFVSDGPSTSLASAGVDQKRASAVEGDVESARPALIVAQQWRWASKAARDGRERDRDAGGEPLTANAARLVGPYGELQYSSSPKEHPRLGAYGSPLQEPRHLASVEPEPEGPPCVGEQGEQGGQPKRSSSSAASLSELLQAEGLDAGDDVLGGFTLHPQAWMMRVSAGRSSSGQHSSGDGHTAALPTPNPHQPAAYEPSASDLNSAASPSRVQLAQSPSTAQGARRGEGQGGKISARRGGHLPLDVARSSTSSRGSRGQGLEVTASRGPGSPAGNARALQRSAASERVVAKSASAPRVPRQSGGAAPSRGRRGGLVTPRSTSGKVAGLAPPSPTAVERSLHSQLSVSSLHSVSSTASSSRLYQSTAASRGKQRALNSTTSSQANSPMAPRPTQSFASRASPAPRDRGLRHQNTVAARYPHKQPTPPAKQQLRQSQSSLVAAARDPGNKGHAPGNVFRDARQPGPAESSTKPSQGTRPQIGVGQRPANGSPILRSQPSVRASTNGGQPLAPQRQPPSAQQSSKLQAAPTRGDATTLRQEKAVEQRLRASPGQLHMMGSQQRAQGQNGKSIQHGWQPRVGSPAME